MRTVLATKDLKETIFLADRAPILPREKGGEPRLIDFDAPASARWEQLTGSRRLSSSQISISAQHDGAKPEDLCKRA